MSISPTDRTLGKPNNYDVVFTDKTDNSTLGKTDFINLMVAQIQNQDFTKPADTSDMLNQMSTLSNMQMMEDMAKYAKQSYAMSMVGKYVTATRNTVSGNTDMTTGRVDKVAMVDDEFVFYIGDKTYKMSQIYSAEVSPTTESTSKTEDSVKADDTTVEPDIPNVDKPSDTAKTPKVSTPDEPVDTEETPPSSDTPDPDTVDKTPETIEPAGKTTSTDETEPVTEEAKSSHSIVSTDETVMEDTL